MQGNGLLVIGLGICVFGFVFMFLGMLLFNRAHHMFKHFFIVGIINKVIGDVKEDVDDEVDPSGQQPFQRFSRGDIRAKAESLDFDAAVAKYSGQNADFKAQRAEPPASRGLDDDRPPVIRRRERTQDRDDYDEDD